MRAKIALSVSGSLLAGALAAQPVPCASVAAEVRDRVREAGACRDAAGDDAASQAASGPSATVTRTLSDGTVVRVPREISSSIDDGPKRAPTNGTAARKGAPPARTSLRSGPNASGDPPPAPQNLNLKVPDVIGRSYADAGSALAEFRVDRIETASAARAGEVLAQEPVPATLIPPGSTVRLQVSDGSLAGSAGADKMSAPTDPPPSAPAPTSDRAPVVVADLAPPATRTPQPATRGRFPADFSPNTALVLGAGVLLGLMLGALLMHQWLLRRAVAAYAEAASPTFRRNEPIHTVTGVSATEAVPEVRFTARRDQAETTIELSPLADDEAVPTEPANEKHG
jgi:hypothetical protein